MATADRSVAFRVRTVECRDIDEPTRAAWAGLEQNALESNAYLSPHFVLPAARHLDSDLRPFAVLVEEAAGGLAGVGVFTSRGPSKRFPLPHLSAFLSRHSYLSGLLVDRRHVEPVVAAFFDFWCGARARWHGVEFSRRTTEGPLAAALAEAADARRIPWHEQSRTQRATLVPALAGDSYLEAELKGGRLKSLRRQMRRLQELGDVSWREVGGPDLPESAVDRFLELEHLGWKGTEGTSLRSRSGDEAFFREATDGFRCHGRAWFTELSLNGTVISSTANFVSGHAGFAFKIGWDPAYAKLSPGMLNEIELVRRAPELFGDLEYLDSGAGEGSYIEEFWTGRRALTSGIFATTALGRKALAFVDAARGLKRRLRRPA
jgi:CelD/BcsL family acetyltransferase involved in cellulose biosynthesis